MDSERSRVDSAGFSHSRKLSGRVRSAHRSGHQVAKSYALRTLH